MPETDEKLSQLEQVFSPSAPIRSRDLFFGRIEQLQKVIEAINERGQHVVLYGERGVGKTSLANVINVGLENALAAKVTCNRTEKFKDVWTKALRKVSFVSKAHGIGFQAVEREEILQLDLFLPNVEEINSLDVQSVLEMVSNPLLFIFDEFDSITDTETRIRFADTIKALSDNAPHVTVFIVGIAENVNQLIGEHASVERCIKQIEMPRMSNEELVGIINKGLEIVDMEMAPKVAQRIIELSSGFPHFTHLLSKYCARSAIIGKTNQIAKKHFIHAINESVENVNQSIRHAYQKATISSKGKSKFKDVVSACALVVEDEYGSFCTNDLIESYYKITGHAVSRESLTYNLSNLCKEERGEILRKVGSSKNIRYRFANPLMKVYAKLKLFQTGKFDHSTLQLI